MITLKITFLKMYCWILKTKDIQATISIKYNTIIYDIMAQPCLIDDS